MKLAATIGGRVSTVEVLAGDPPVLIIDGRRVTVDARETSPGLVSFLVEGRSREVGVLPREGGYTVTVGGRVLEVAVSEGAGAAAGPRHAAGPARVTAPMPGRIVKVLAEAGQEVAEGQGLVVMEAMKMENELRAPRAGRVKEMHARERQAVETGALLAVVE